MLRRSLYLITALIVGSVLPAMAGTATCLVASGTSSVFTALPDCSPIFSPSATLDWGYPISPGSASSGLGAALSSMYPEPLGTVLNASISGDAFTIASNDQLTRADNAELAWSSTYNAWIPAGFVAPDLNFFAGNFGAATSPSSPQPYGDDLLGALAPGDISMGQPTLTFSFTQTLQYIAFQVSSATVANFNVELVAFDSSHNQIGTYMVQDTGDGGSTCAGLSNPSGPTPCDTAPLIQFFDPQGRIASVELVMLNDLSGVYIDTLEASAVPEPVSGGLAAAGLSILLWTARRRRLRDQAAAMRD